MNTRCPDPNRRILVIDDNPAIHQDFAKIFGSDGAAHEIDAATASFFDDDDGVAAPSASAGFTLDFAHQGEEGHAMVVAANSLGLPYAMAFVDVRMPPGWDGVETIEHLWQVQPSLQAVICTAFSDHSWEEIVARLPMSDQLLILKKPFDNIEVRQMAGALTAKWQLAQVAGMKMEKMQAMASVLASELHKLDELFRLIAENASDLITIWTREGKRLYSSPSHERVLGASPGSLLDASLFEPIHPADQPRVRSTFERCAQRGTAEVLEYRMRHRKGFWRNFETHVNPVAGDGGGVEHLVIIARDITDRFAQGADGFVYEIDAPGASALEVNR